MKRFHLVVAVLLSTFWSEALAQDLAKPAIRLEVLHDGHALHGPRNIKMAFCGTWIILPLRDHKFVIPPNLPGCPLIDLQVRVGNAFLQPTGIPAGQLRAGAWKILFAEKRFGQGFDSYVKPQQQIEKMCVVSFEPDGQEGTFLLDPHCRS